MLPPIWARRSRVRLLFEAGDLAQVVELEDPHVGGVVGRDRLRGDGDVGVPLDVRLEELVEVHAVEVIAGKDRGSTPRRSP